MAISSSALPRPPGSVSLIFRKLATRLAGQVEDDQRNRNYRWMYFLVFSMLLGGKLAGTTAKLFSFDARSGSETRRVLRLLGRGVGLLHRAVCRGVAALGEFGRVAARLAWRRAVVSGQQKPPPEGW
jgi:hypothetical protein